MDWKVSESVGAGIKCSQLLDKIVTVL